MPQPKERAKLTPWPEKSTLTKEAILRAFHGEGLSPHQWSNQPGYVYPDYRHPYHKMIYVVQGSITFNFPQIDQTLTMVPAIASTWRQT